MVYLGNRKHSGVNSALVQATIISHLDPCNTFPSSTPAPQSPCSSQTDPCSDHLPTQNTLIAHIYLEQNPEALATAFDALTGVTPASLPTSFFRQNS